MRITLCGSAKFEKEFHQWNETLTLAGHIVYDLAVHPSYKGSKDWYDDTIKQTLDLAHLAKIMHSDAIVVVHDSYIGFSTNREIEWAKMLGKKIYYASKLDPKGVAELARTGV